MPTDTLRVSTPCLAIVTRLSDGTDYALVVGTEGLAGKRTGLPVLAEGTDEQCAAAGFPLSAFDGASEYDVVAYTPDSGALLCLAFPNADDGPYCLLLDSEGFGGAGLPSSLPLVAEGTPEECGIVLAR